MGQYVGTDKLGLQEVIASGLQVIWHVAPSDAMSNLASALSYDNQDVQIHIAKTHLRFLVPIPGSLLPQLSSISC